MQQGKFDNVFQVKLDSWTMFRHRVHQLFSQREIDSLQRAERLFDDNNRTVVYLSFESKFAPLGGLAAVAKLLPVNLLKAEENVIFISPYHCKCVAMVDAITNGTLKEIFSSVFHLCNFEGTLTCYQDTTATLPSYYIGIDGFFDAGENPYGYTNPEDLLEDSLAFSASVPFVLSRLGIQKNIILHANDWETAPVAISSKFAVVSNLLLNARTVLTLHNSFDTGISRETKLKFFGMDVPGFTVLQCCIPWLNGPLTTVSTPFAHELRNDPLQRGIFTDHLQTEFAMNPPIGIENGMFGENENSYPVAVVKKAIKGDFESLLQKKNQYRKNFCKLISSAVNEQIKGRLTVDSMSDNVPIYFMSGRLDIMQKGFDVIFNAFEQLERGSAKLFFCPSSNSNGNLAFFEKIAKRCDGDITIWPFRISQVEYEHCIKGATFLIMPSLYEPFGAATEGYIQGTPVIVRGTGGLWTQVEPWNHCKVPEFYGSLLDGKNRVINQPTGIVYHEDFPEDIAEKMWRGMLQSPLEDRMKNPLYCSIVNAAADALKIAGELFNTSGEYARVIANGFEMVRQFSWSIAVSKYKKIYNTAATRGI